MYHLMFMGDIFHNFFPGKRNFKKISDPPNITEQYPAEIVPTRPKLLPTFSKARRKLFKVVNDPIHGHIELHPLCVTIIDTPQFQRLRNIKQLGACYFVYPGASHNRFEHSIGVCHLAGRLGRALKTKQKELDITDTDILCLEVAGLCHDLGHGPFSHLFDQMFIPKVNPDSKWKHEKASVDMFRYLVEDNKLKDVFEKNGLHQKDMVFVEELIVGAGKQDGPWTCKGREEDKSFLYEVVANNNNGIDVDKWDYFARDSHGLGIKSSFDHLRAILFAKVIKVDGRRHICFKDKEAENLYDMFYTRYSLHKRAYQHPVNKIIERMLTEAFVKANDHLKFSGKDGVPLKMSEAVNDMVAYMQMTDSVVDHILKSDHPDLKASKKILNNIFKRNLYKFVANKQLTSEKIQKIEEKLRESSNLPVDKNKLLLKEKLEDHLNDQVGKDKFVIQVLSFDYGNKEKNPMDRVHFFSKDKPDEAFSLPDDQFSSMLPTVFAEKIIGVYTKTDGIEEQLRTAFNEWFEKH